MNHLNKIILYITAAMPLAFVAGRFISDLFVVISSILLITIIIKTKQYYYFFNKISIFFFFWCLLIVTISLTSAEPILSLSSSLLYVRFGFFALAIIYAINNNKNWFNICLNFFIASYLVCILFSFIEVLFGFNLTIWVIDGYRPGIQSAVFGNKRLTGTFGQDVMLGSYLSRTLPIFFAIVIYNYKIIKPNTLILIGLIIPLLFIFTFMSHERVSIFYSLFFVFFFLISSNHFKKLSLIVSASFLGILFIFLIFNKIFFHRLITTTLKQADIFTSNSHFFSVQYEVYFSTAYNIFLDNFFFGVGPKLYRVSCLEYPGILNSCNTHPHSLFLQILAETGIIGSLPWIVFIIFLFFSLFKHIILKFFLKNIYLSDYKICLLIASIISIFPIMPSGSFFNNYIASISYLSFALYLQTFNYINKSNAL